ncbi:MAG: hypothetical protein AAF517_03360, partial [Planctomycetota bacterium]
RSVLAKALRKPGNVDAARRWLMAQEEKAPAVLTAILDVHASKLGDFKTPSNDFLRWSFAEYPQETVMALILAEEFSVLAGLIRESGSVPGNPWNYLGSIPGRSTNPKGNAELLAALIPFLLETPDGDGANPFQLSITRALPTAVELARREPLAIPYLREVAAQIFERPAPEWAEGTRLKRGPRISLRSSMLLRSAPSSEWRKEVVKWLSSAPPSWRQLVVRITKSDLIWIPEAIPLLLQELTRDDNTERRISLLAAIGELHRVPSEIATQPLPRKFLLESVLALSRHFQRARDNPQSTSREPRRTFDRGRRSPGPRGRGGRPNKVDPKLQNLDELKSGLFRGKENPTKRSETKRSPPKRTAPKSEKRRSPEDASVIENSLWKRIQVSKQLLQRLSRQVARVTPSESLNQALVDHLASKPFFFEYLHATYPWGSRTDREWPRKRLLAEITKRPPFPEGIALCAEFLARRGPDRKSLLESGPGIDPELIDWFEPESDASSRRALSRYLRRAVEDSTVDRDARELAFAALPVASASALLDLISQPSLLAARSLHHHPNRPWPQSTLDPVQTRGMHDQALRRISAWLPYTENPFVLDRYDLTTAPWWKILTDDERRKVYAALVESGEVFQLAAAIRVSPSLDIPADQLTGTFVRLASRASDSSTDELEVVAMALTSLPAESLTPEVFKSLDRFQANDFRDYVAMIASCVLVPYTPGEPGRSPRAVLRFGGRGMRPDAHEQAKALVARMREKGKQRKTAKVKPSAEADSKGDSR